MERSSIRVAAYVVVLMLTVLGAGADSAVAESVSDDAGWPVAEVQLYPDKQVIVHRIWASEARLAFAKNAPLPEVTQDGKKISFETAEKDGAKVFRAGDPKLQESLLELTYTITSKGVDADYTIILDSFLPASAIPAPTVSELKAINASEFDWTPPLVGSDGKQISPGVAIGFYFSDVKSPLVACLLSAPTVVKAGGSQVVDSREVTIEYRIIEALPLTLKPFAEAKGDESEKTLTTVTALSLIEAWPNIFAIPGRLLVSHKGKKSLLSEPVFPNQDQVPVRLGEIANRDAHAIVKVQPSDDYEQWQVTGLKRGIVTAYHQIQIKLDREKGKGPPTVIVMPDLPGWKVLQGETELNLSEGDAAAEWRIQERLARSMCLLLRPDAQAADIQDRLTLARLLSPAGNQTSCCSALQREIDLLEKELGLLYKTVPAFQQHGNDLLADLSASASMSSCPELPACESAAVDALRQAALDSCRASGQLIERYNAMMTGLSGKCCRSQSETPDP